MANTVEELLLRIQGDSSSGQQAVQQLATALSGALAKALSDVKKSTDDSNQATSALKKYLDDLTPSTKDAHAAFTDLKSTLTGLWEHPTEQIGSFVKALAVDLGPALGAIGIAAGLTVAAIATVGVAALEASEQSAKIGTSIQDTAYKTGIAVPALATWRGALEIAGSSLDQFGNAIFMMQRRMVEGGPQFQAGMDRITLSMADLNGLQPDQQFLKIAEGIRAIENPAERSAAAMELFGRPGRDLLPLIMKNLGELNDESEKLGSTWSGQDAKAAEDFEMASRGLNLQLENIKTVIGRDLIPLFTQALNFAKGSIGWLITSGPLGTTLELLKLIDKLHQAPATAAQLAVESGILLPGGLNGGARPKGGADLRLPAGPETVESTAAAAAAQAYLDKLSESAKKGVELDAQNARVAEGLAKLGIVMNDDANVAGEMNKAWDASVKSAEALEKAYTSALTNITDLLSGQGVEWDWTAEQALKYHASVSDIATVLGMSHGAIQAVAEDLKNEDEILKRVNSSHDENLAVVLGVTKAVSQDLHPTLLRLAQAMGDVQLSGLNVGNSLTYVHDNAATADALLKQLNGTIGLMPDLTKAAADNMRHLTASTSGFTDAFTDSVHAIPRLLEDAFTGGGGLSGAIKGLGAKIGGDLGKEISKSIRLGMSTDADGNESQSKKGALGSSLLSGGIAALASVGISKLFDWIGNIGGPSQDELAARDTFKQVQLSGESLTDTIKRLSAELVKAGQTGPQAQRLIQDALDATHRSAEAEAASLAKINGIINEQKQDDADLTAAVQRYKFSLEELGPTMQKQQLDQQAQQLLNDWRLLVGSGMQIATVNEHMATSVQSYLDAARNTGQEVPAAMQPILQKMIEQGLLTDAAGKKVTDLKGLGVSFAETMSAGFDKVVSRLDALLQGLGLIPKALAAIPPVTDFTVNGHYNGPDPSSFLPGDQFDPSQLAYGSRGGLVSAAGIQYLRDGSAMIERLSRGSDTVHAMLTPGEAVLTQRARSTLGTGAIAALNRGSTLPAALARSSAGAGAGVTVNVALTVEGSVLSEGALIETVGNGLKNLIEQAITLPLGH